MAKSNDDATRDESAPRAEEVIKSRMDTKAAREIGGLSARIANMKSLAWAE